jgi:glycerol-3-phosphate dehydrogenase
MNRDEMIENITTHRGKWDFIIIGGGATGLGAAIDAASRGYRPLLVEQNDFAKGTSSRSTKLVHGGVRYLKQGNISLVLEALRERGLLAQNAPHLVHHMEFVVPIYNWWEGPFYGIGMKVYDRLAGKLGLSPSKVLTYDETIQHIPTVEPAGLRRGVSYYDGQFDDSRLAINLAQTAVDNGAVVVNYMPVIALMKKDDLVVGVITKDLETGKEYELEGRAIINATGVFTDLVRKMDDQSAKNIVAVSQVRTFCSKRISCLEIVLLWFRARRTVVCYLQSRGTTASLSEQRIYRLTNPTLNRSHWRKKLISLFRMPVNTSPGDQSVQKY